MDDSSLRADCARCAGLCCVGLSFQRASGHFAFDKAAGQACPHLNGRDRCRIHRRLLDRGMTGCAHFDCDGAGQRVVNEVFLGARWQDRPELLAPMLDAFRALREVHALLVLLRHARRLPLTASQERERAAWEGVLDPPGRWSAAALACFERDGVARRARAFLRALGEAPNLASLRGAGTGACGADPASRRLPLVHP